MRTLAWTLFVLCLPAGFTQDAQNDFQKIQGKWKVVELHKREKSLPVKDFEEVRFIFDKDVCKQTSRRGDRVCMIKLDASVKPRTIAMTFDDKTTQGIYELDGDDTLKMCAPSDNIKFRPTEFKSTNGCLVWVLKRVKD